MTPHLSVPVRGFEVGSVRVDPPLVLAPMEEVTNQPFRLICKRIGGVGLLVTEFVSAMALHYGAQKSRKKMKVGEDERPLAIQIFGSDPASMAAAARTAEEMGADIVDINMGCWVPKVCKTGSGAALLRDPDTAIRVAEAVVSAVQVPVSVKVRAGWDSGKFAAPELAKRFEDIGIAMITLHARFAKQGFDGEADWRLIADLRDAVNIPLVGNGDIRSGADALEMFSRTGCNGVMVGRAAISNPWVLRDIRHTLAGQPTSLPPTLRERIEVAIEHAKGLIQFEAGVGNWGELEAMDSNERKLAEDRAIRHLRGQLPLYVKSFRGAARIREAISRCSTLGEVQGVFDEALAYHENESA